MDVKLIIGRAVVMFAICVGAFTLGTFIHSTATGTPFEFNVLIDLVVPAIIAALFSLRTVFASNGRR